MRDQVTILIEDIGWQRGSVLPAFTFFYGLYFIVYLKNSNHLQRWFVNVCLDR
ncbi:hypothetical protein NMYAN_290004 [Nitrosomonas nitrosa]|uniref:Uncharacterized protein n=1 Tax=Nitrosomonas nitrosa TaxID=52442 RepID=A0A8H9D9B1_9PROT|nr:hypothetical protein NMYAN_290004 [Nitrosomonas nitrosa]